MDPLLSREQTGFWHGRSTIDQVTLLTQEIEDRFLAQKETQSLLISQQSIILYDIIASPASYLVFFQTGTHVSLITELVCNQSFILTINAGKQSRLQCLKNDIPQGSVLAPLLFSIYDLPVAVAIKFAYADDLAILHYASNWQVLEGTLT